VALGTKATEGVPVSAPPDISQLAWFQDQEVRFDLPGFNDFVPGVLSAMKPIGVRALARNLEVQPLGRSPLLNVTPLILFSIWPYNMAETFLRVIVPWVHWLATNPDMERRPLVLAAPHGLELPSFWRLLENMGVAVETFAALSAPTQGTQPFCFEEVIGCKVDTRSPSELDYRATDEGVAWESFRRVTVAHHCPGLAGTAQAQAQVLQGPEAALEKEPLVVAFADRSTPRRIRNLDQLLAECRQATTPGGRPISCRKIHFKDVAQDVCKLQDIDVLVGTHGAHLSNALLMRPGTSLIELRASQWIDPIDQHGRIIDVQNWDHFFAALLWMTNSTRYWMYKAPDEDSFAYPGSPYPGRDSDVNARWAWLRCMLGKVEQARGNAAFHASLTTTMGAGCQPLSDITQHSL